MRLPDDFDIAKEKYKHSQCGVLQFEDGSQKTLAGFLCWLGLIALLPEFDEEEFRTDGVQALIHSLTHLGTVFKKGHADMVDSMVSRVVKQNADSKVQPINSFQWAMLLQSLFSKSEHVTLDMALQKYNQRPEVQAQGGKMTELWLDGSSEPLVFVCLSRVFQTTRGWANVLDGFLEPVVTLRATYRVLDH